MTLDTPLNAKIVMAGWARGASLGEIASEMGPEISRADILRLAQDIGLIGKPQPKPSRQELQALKSLKAIVQPRSLPVVPPVQKAIRVYLDLPEEPAKTSRALVPLPELPPQMARKPVVIVEPQPEPAPKAIEPREDISPPIVADITDTNSSYPILRLRLGDCKWPLGDVGTPGFDFCRQPAETDKPYCPAHCKEAYAPTPGHARRRAA